MKKLLIGCIGLFFLQMYGDNSSQRPQSEQKPGFFQRLAAAPTIAKNIWNKNSAESAGQALATYYGARMLATLGHELGHSVTSTLLTGKLAPIFLGGNKSIPIPIFPFPGPIFISGVQFTGSTLTLKPEPHQELPFLTKFIATIPEQSPRQFFISSAGPAAGIATSLALLKAPYVYEEYQKSKDIKQACQLGLQKPLEWQDISLALVAASFMGVTQNVMNLIPINEEIDGYKILKILNASTKTMNFAKHGMLGVYAGTSIYLTKKFYDICYEKHGQEPA